MQLPDATLRLFHSYRPEDLVDAAGRDLLIGRLLEEGDRRDLRWLTAEIDGAELARWLEARGVRQLSRRSLAFWSRLFDTTPEDSADDALWPL